MIECIFTLDYEIYGNGRGSLRHLVHDPAQRLMAIFREENRKFVAFIEAAELEMIRMLGTDEAISDVERQVRELYRDGFEIGLHLHPQWYKGRYEGGAWVLEHREYNLCSLPRARIREIVERSVGYLRSILCSAEYTPLSFRAGNWLLQPTETAASVLHEQGIRIDSSVFKGGLQRGLGLDYRPALKNGYYWRFQRDVNEADPEGCLIELPTHSTMVPAWKMVTRKRVSTHLSSPSGGDSTGGKLLRYRDFLRLRYPRKFDYCRMSYRELREMLEPLLLEDRCAPDTYRPIVAIGHTKDLRDGRAIADLLRYLSDQQVRVSTFQDIYSRRSERTVGARLLNTCGEQVIAP